MKMKVHGVDCAFDVNTPGDLHFINGIHNLNFKAPKCAGIQSGDAKIISMKIGIEIPEIGYPRKDFDFERIVCPDGCKISEERCLIQYVK